MWAALLSSGAPQPVRAQSTLLYQGQVCGAHGPVNASYDMTFRLYEAAEGSESLWEESFDDVPVVDGTFGVGPPGPKGDAGDLGPDGAPSLIAMTHEPSGVTCATGGRLFRVGTDVNRDGVLSPTEVTASENNCNGLPGETGPSGAAGERGPAGAPGAAG